MSSKMHINIEGLSSLILDSIPEERAAILRKHLEGCEECRGEEDRLRKVIEAMESNKSLDPALLTKSDTCPDDSSLFEYAEKNLSSSESKEVGLHLGRCDYCTHLIASYIRDEFVEASEPEVAVSERLTERVRNIYRPVKEEGVSFLSRLKDMLLPEVQVYRYAMVSSIPVVAFVAYLIYSIAFPSLQFDVELMGKHSYAVRGAKEVSITDGAVLYSGDSFYVKVGTNREIYAYVLLLDSRNELQWLFPGPGADYDNHIKGGSRYLIPPDSGWLLDDKSGTEVVFILASTKQVSGLEKILHNLKREATSPLYGQKAYQELFRTDTIESISGNLKHHFNEVKVVQFEHR